MASADRWQPVLSSLAPALYPDEAISSWLFRVADAHLLTRGELAAEIGADPESLERGHIDSLDRVSEVTGVSLDRLVAAVHPQLIAKPLPLFRLSREAVVCHDCLLEDRKAGRELYTRTTWMYPLAVNCPVHKNILMPSQFPFAFHLERKGKIQDDPLRSATSQHTIQLRARLGALLMGTGKAGAMPADLSLLGRLRSLIGDLVDALRSEPRSGAASLMRSVNWGIRQFSPRLTRHMIADGLADLEPFDRLKHVLVAMAILAEPDENGPIAGFVQECQYRLPERSVDPLAALAAGLTKRDFTEFDLRTAEWPSKLKARWATVRHFATLRPV